MRLFSNINLGQIVANKTIQVEVGAAESDSTFNALTALDVSGLSIPAQACFVGVIVSFTCCERISIFFMQSLVRRVHPIFASHVYT